MNMEYPEHLEPVVIDTFARVKTWNCSDTIDQKVSLKIIFTDRPYVSVGIGSFQKVHDYFKAENNIDDIFNLDKLCVSNI
jgi:hypothetical protein